MKFFAHIGKYIILLKNALSKPEKPKMYYRQITMELEKIGINSIGIVVIISFFFGAVITLQTANNMENPLFPDYLVGLTTRDSMLLEFTSTILCLILAGKVGSNIASEIGTMRVTEQIDALEIMGVNSASFLIFPKIIAAVFIFPFLSLISMVVGLFGGWVIGIVTGEVPSQEYIYGIRYAFIPFYMLYGIVKTVIFSFLIITVSSYFGYYTEGGALDVGRASTKAVVNSMVSILIFNLIITQLMLL